MRWGGRKLTEDLLEVRDGSLHATTSHQVRCFSRTKARLWTGSKLLGAAWERTDEAGQQILDSIHLSTLVSSLVLGSAPPILPHRFIVSTTALAKVLVYGVPEDAMLRFNFSRNHRFTSSQVSQFLLAAQEQSSQC
jgi:hypothetical protein